MQTKVWEGGDPAPQLSVMASRCWISVLAWLPCSDSDGHGNRQSEVGLLARTHTINTRCPSAQPQDILHNDRMLHHCVALPFISEHSVAVEIPSPPFSNVFTQP